MQHAFNDGGRAAAGYAGRAGDCVVRAIAIAGERPYQEVYNELKALAKTERVSKRRRGRSTVRDGVYKSTYRLYLASKDWRFTPTMGIGTGCRVHLKDGELPSGRLIVVTSRHLVAVINGIIHDTHNPSRDGTRCVYGYFTKG